jgi:tetratricopeptide (TPR) repeat protein
MLDLSERADFSPELARSYASLCVAIGLIPVHALARIYQRRAREIAQSVNDLPTQAFVSMGTSVYDMGIGQWAQAQPILSQGIEVSDRLGDHQRWAENMILLEQVAYYQGMFTDGEKLATDIYTRSYRYGNILHQAWGLSGQGENKLRLGQTDEAIALLEKALALYAETMDRISIITTYGLLAIAHLRRMKDLSPDDRRQAQQAAEMATQMIGQSPPTSYYLLEGYAGIAEVYLALWEAEWISVHKPPNWNSSLHISTKQACKALHKYTRIFPIGQPHAWLWQGLYYWLSGKPSKAYKAWQRSLVAGERLGMLYEQGLTHYEMGRHLEIDSPMRPMHLTRACEIFSQLSAAYDLARAQAVLDRN